ncbi:hypothetical protein H4219_000008 [Mycoemilia scoparia]|uniref:Uncharacterized protein n=1 Tax=Mycoemilia scoparia TaxID=417184 RepID=A0A9W8A967_9FUNG|nr:hypothetical protein H4219_000008 [Mycoemilia scoparia]
MSDSTSTAQKLRSENHTSASPDKALASDPYEVNEPNLEDNAMSINIKNIRSFKETVVNTSRLLRVYNKQQKDLAQANEEISKLKEEAQKLQRLNAMSQRDLESKVFECKEIQAEAESTRKLLQRRENELSSIRAIREDLESKLSEIQASKSQGEKTVTKPYPKASFLSAEIEKLKDEITKRDGTIKSLRIQRDAAKSNARAEVMTLRVKLDKSLVESQGKHDKEVERLQQEIERHKSDLVKEQEKCIELEMDSGMKQVQIDDLERQIKTFSSKIESAQQLVQKTKAKLKEENKEKMLALRQALSQKQKELGKKDKIIAELQKQLEKKSNSTPDIEISQVVQQAARLEQELRYYQDIAKSFQVELEELKREQPLEKRKPRGKMAAAQQEIDELKAQVEKKDEELIVAKNALSAIRNSTENRDVAPRIDYVVEAQELRVQIEKRDATIERLEREVARLREDDLNTMKLRNASSSRTQTRSTPTPPADTGVPTYHKEDIVQLRKERAALLELIAEQQLQLRELRISSGIHAPLNPIIGDHLMTPSRGLNCNDSLRNTGSTRSSAAQRKRNSDGGGEVGVDTYKRPKTGPHSQEFGSPMYFSSIATSFLETPKNRTPATTGARKLDAGKGKPKSSTKSTPITLVTIKRHLCDMRLNDTSRANRFMEYLYEQPQVFISSIQQMQRPILDIDPSTFVTSLSKMLSKPQGGQSAKSVPILPEALRNPQDNNDKGLSTCTNETVISKPLPKGVPFFEANVALALWNIGYKQQKGSWVESIAQNICLHIILNNNDSVSLACMLTRIFSTFCYLSADLMRCRVFCTELLIEAVDKPHVLPVIANMAAVWPLVLIKPQQEQNNGISLSSPLQLFIHSLESIISGLFDIYSKEKGADEAKELYQVFTEICLWSKPDKAEYTDKMYNRMVEIMNAPSNDSAKYQSLLKPALKLIKTYCAP